MIAVNELSMNESFFYTPPSALRAAMDHLKRYRAAQAYAGENEIDVNDEVVRSWARLYAEPHLVTGRVKQTGEVLSQRASDGKRFVWYNKVPALVEVYDRPELFEARLRELQQQKKKLAEEEARMRKARKKARREVEVDA